MSSTKNNPLIIVNSNPTFNFLEFGGIKSWVGLRIGYRKSFAKDGEADNSVIKKYLTTANDSEARIEASSQDDAITRKFRVVQQESDWQVKLAREAYGRNRLCSR